MAREKSLLTLIEYFTDADVEKSGAEFSRLLQARPGAFAKAALSALAERMVEHEQDDRVRNEMTKALCIGMACGYAGGTPDFDSWVADFAEHDSKVKGENVVGINTRVGR